MVRIVRGVRARERGVRPGSMHKGIIQDSQSKPMHGSRLRDSSPSSSDDSTQSPNVVNDTECLDGYHTTEILNKKPGHGQAKSVKFDMLRKVRPIPITIKDGDTKVSCEHASIFSGRVTWIVKHYADMRYQRWSDVPLAEKEELCNRVRANFTLQWEKSNHQQAVIYQLRRRFNYFHYQLHKIYTSYGNHKLALAKGTMLVDDEVWKKLCTRWGSKEFKALSLQNKANREKQRTNHTSGRKSFVRLLEEKNEMVEKFHALEPEARTKEASKVIFREVLGKRPRYERGLGKTRMPESSHIMVGGDNTTILSEDAQYYKNQFEELKSNVMIILQKQDEFNKFMKYSMLQQKSHGESLRET